MAFEIIRYVGALLLVLALIGVAGVAARKWGVPGVTRAVRTSAWRWLRPC